MIDETFEPQCKLCGDVYDSVRYDIGYHICMSCGDEVAKLVKSNYMLVTNRDDLIGINNKGGLVK